VKCIAWNFDGSNFIGSKMWGFSVDKNNLKKLRFEDGDAIPDVESYFEE
jgi:hypothetical protein